MKKLFRKELKEQTKVAVLALVLLTFFFVVHYRTYVKSIKDLSGDATQPLLAASWLVDLGIFCAVFGVVLGWLQSRAEKHPDLWAFLVNRPMTRTAIWRTKILAGLFLYTLGAGVPIAVFIMFVLTPGYVAAPFEWPMLYPMTGVFLVGMPFYLAGILTGLRQARWYGSRGFGLGAAIMAGFAVFNLKEFSQAFLVLGLTVGVLAIATWGSFEAGGFYRKQPGAGKLALSLACATSSLLILFIAIIFLIQSLGPENRMDWFYSNYAMTTNGVVYKRVSCPPSGTMVYDLNDKLVIDEKTGRAITEQEFLKRCAPTWGIYARFESLFDGKYRYLPGYMDNLRFFEPWLRDDKTCWYLRENGSLAEYSLVTRRQIDVLRAPEPLRLPSDRKRNDFNSGTLEYLASPTTLYRVITEERSLKPIFSVSGGDAIGGYEQAKWEKDDQVLSRKIIVLTKKFVNYLHPDGRMEWSLPYQPSFVEYPSVEINLLQPTNRFAVEFWPMYYRRHSERPTEIKYLTSEQGVLSAVSLPAPIRSDFSGYEEKIPFLYAPPLMPVLIDHFYPYEEMWNPLCLISAVVSAMVGLWLGRRYSFSAKDQIGWAIFNLFFSVPGLLAFLCVQEFPAQEACPHCKKPRVVDREKCPHCGGDFNPPAKNGTEIFEALSVS